VFAVETLLEYGVVVLAIGALPASVVWSRRVARRRGAAEWRVAIRSAHQGGTVVELVRPGEHPQRITRLDPADDEFSTKLEDARAAALERAVALNVARRDLTP
jgi:DNA-binding transcriptional regulator YdaS (Cro superfamily)